MITKSTWATIKIKEGHGDGYISTDTAKPGHGALVESPQATLFPGGLDAVPGASVLACLKPLHLGFDYINWCVAKHTHSTSHCTSKECLENSLKGGAVKVARRVSEHPSLQLVKSDEPQSLVTALFDHRWKQTLVAAA